MSFEKVFIAFVVLFSMSFFAQKSNRVLLYEGNSAFEKKNYTEAIRKYSQAVDNDQKDFNAMFNLGNALYKDKKYAEAEAMYSKAHALAKDKKDRGVAQYNIGNARFQAGSMDAAAEAYKKSLKEDPEQEFARKNLQIVKKKLEKQQQNQQNNKEKEKNDASSDEKKKGNEPKNDGKSPQNGGNNGNQKGKGSEDSGKQNDGNNHGSKPEIPNAIREKILNQLSERERETARKILNKPSYSEPRSNEKDW